MLVHHLAFLGRINDLLNLSQNKIEIERFEIRVQLRNRWVLQLIPKMNVVFIVVLRARF